MACHSSKRKKGKGPYKKAPMGQAAKGGLGRRRENATQVGSLVFLPRLLLTEIYEAFDSIRPDRPKKDRLIMVTALWPHWMGQSERGKENGNVEPMAWLPPL